MSVELIQLLSDNMANSPKDLLAYIEFYYFRNTDEYEDASFLVRNQMEAEQWVDLWDGDPESVQETNRKFRAWKIDYYWMSQDEFVELAYLDLKDAIETSFVHIAGKRTLLELESALGSGMTYKELHTWHSYCPLSRMEYLLFTGN